MNDEHGTMNHGHKPPASPPNGHGFVEQPRGTRVPPLIIHHSSFIVFFSLCLCVPVAPSARGQLETVDDAAPAPVTWVGHGQIEGHLAINYSPAGAFSPDSTALAVVAEGKVILMDLAAGGIRKVLRPRIEGVSDLSIHSASFAAPDRIFILGNGVYRTRSKTAAPATPTLAFMWDVASDALSAKVNTIGGSGGYTPPRFFPMIGYVAIYKETQFDLWHPLTGRGGRITVPALTRQPNLYDLSPDGHWLLLAQLEGSGGADPIAVDIREGKFADSLRGQQGTTLSIAFSRNNQRIVTACEDGKVRVWSVGDWKLLRTLAGHSGTVQWAEFSPDGRWIVSGGYDKTVRIWSAEDGSLAQILTEAREPIRTVAFSPSGGYVAASAEQMVWVWRLVKQ